MESSSSALTLEEVNTIRTAMRAGRFLAVVMAALLAVAVPFLLELLAPVIGVALLVVIVLSPVLVTALLLLAARQSAKEQRQLSA